MQLATRRWVCGVAAWIAIRGVGVVQKDGAWMAYIACVILVIIVDTVNGFVLHNVNRGMDFVLFTAAFIVFLVKFIRLRKKHELIPLIFWGVLSISMLVVWILQLCRVF